MTVKTALVTGTSRQAALGFAVARELAEQGYHVFLTASERSATEPLAARLRQDGYAATALRLDLSDRASIGDRWAPHRGLRPPRRPDQQCQRHARLPGPVRAGG